MAPIGTLGVDKECTPITTVHGINLAKFHLVSKEDLKEVWDNWSETHLSKCLPYQSSDSLTSIYKALSEDKLQLWLVIINKQPVASFTLTVEHYPLENCLCVKHLGGWGIRKWGGELAPLLDDIAKANDCTSVVSMGRKGTEKLYKQWGFEFEAVRLKRKVI